MELIDNQGWNFDKYSQSQNRCLSAEDLIPLLNLKCQPSDLPYFTIINNYLLRLVKTEPILELIEIDVKSSTDEIRPTSFTGSDGKNLVVVELIKQTVVTNSPQVSCVFFFFLSIKTHGSFSCG